MTVEGVGWSVSGKTLLEDISFDVGSGEMLGLIGPNGSGKSTLLRIMAGLRQPKSGHVTLHGRPMAELRQREIALSLALVEQQADTADRLSVKEAVDLGRTPHLSALRPWSAADEAITLQALSDVGLDAFQDRLWHSLSGGERQRAHIARALAQEPKILLLDEPTNHLDIHHQLAILDLVRQLPITVVVALHDLNQAMACDRLAVLQHGRLVDLGPPRQVLTAERLQTTFGVSAVLLTDPEDGTQVMRFTKAL